MQAATPPTYANVVFLRLPGFAALAAAEQASAKEGLEARVRGAISALPEDGRIVLDADDGLAIVAFGDPERALDLAQSILASAAGLPLLAGLNYGPLAATARGPEGRAVGDGLAAAAAAARYAPPGQVLVTQDFAAALEATAPERRRELVTAGNVTDTRVRQHTFFTHEPKRGQVARRRADLLSAAIVLVILLAGLAGREAYQAHLQSRPHVVTFEVKPPRGEVLVDGKAAGRLPELAQLEVAPGRHRIVIRSPGFVPYDATREYKPGGRTTVTHVFVRAPQPRGSDFFNDLKKRLGN
jgi:hypothetical protein